MPKGMKKINIIFIVNVQIFIILKSRAIIAKQFLKIVRDKFVANNPFYKK